MHVTEVIKKPVLTEKTYLGHADGTYTFIVDRRANKTQIKKTFEEIFEVKVKSVRTLNYDGKAKRLGRFEGKTNNYKKAVITLKDGEQLDILNDL
ncbi:50S ribosomal protein L23 [Mesoplasma lactucae]|uniref:Large ribosomal subunit protein uL23 n=1 Tax=Mesoplasma lactucae ATCC 49193 TaxID=81460 RepID=A0A291IQP8_9MOLU|nr:50S ribosomal protein L23 [Mesoplasma lactucae]ATG97172.1 50S ribosomal protein L23 [Mesoplasma lactucae ATCC 49193]ATZ20388.1 50S ribosomal protein L23 [Mesoplasma lactucae ATCC 49193]MCL8216559.1 50S ribosomal protein L23 [Mesoplasma lactucae ATCC 49193]